MHRKFSPLIGLLVAATLMAVLTALCIAVAAAEFSIINPGETTLPVSENAPSVNQTD